MSLSNHLRRAIVQSAKTSQAVRASSQVLSTQLARGYCVCPSCGSKLVESAKHVDDKLVLRASVTAPKGAVPEPEPIAGAAGLTQLNCTHCMKLNEGLAQNCPYRRDCQCTQCLKYILRPKAPRHDAQPPKTPPQTHRKSSWGCCKTMFVTGAVLAGIVGWTAYAAHPSLELLTSVIYDRTYEDPSDAVVPREDAVSGQANARETDNNEYESDYNDKKWS